MFFLVTMLLPIALVGLAVSCGDDDDDTQGEEITGDAQENHLTGSQGDDLIQGLAGDDVLIGRSGDDTIFGQDGDDILEGEDGDDMLCSGDGDDIVTGNRGADLIEGQDGDDWLSGDYSGDAVYGNDGDDTVIGGRGMDRVAGNHGDDVLFGGIIANVPLNTAEMEDLRDGSSLLDFVDDNGRINMRDDSMGNTLFGGLGDDELFLGSGDRATGGMGEDSFNIMSAQRGPAGPAVLMDYDEVDDAITIIVDGPLDAFNVDVTTEDDETAITVNGRLVGCIMNGAGAGLTAADITLLQETDVAALFDPNAPIAAA